MHSSVCVMALLTPHPPSTKKSTKATISTMIARTTCLIYCCYTFLAIVLRPVVSFSTGPNNCPPARTSTTRLEATSRRDWILTTTSVLGSGVLLLPPQEAHASSLPIAVLGASGRTGALCVTACLERGIPVKALTRSGSWTNPDSSSNNDSSCLLYTSPSPRD